MHRPARHTLRGLTPVLCATCAPLVLLASVGCVAHDPVVVVAPANYPAWPSGAAPDDCPVYVHNEIIVAAKPAVVWAWLVRPDLWPGWFDGASGVKGEGTNPVLVVGTQLAWHMIGADIRVEVKRVDVGTRLEWEGGAGGVHAYHTWLIEPAPDGGTRIVTDETERGVLPWLLRGFIHGRVHDAHQAWIESLGRVAAKGESPT